MNPPYWTQRWSPAQMERALRNAISWKRKYTKAARISLGQERLKYLQAVDNEQRWIDKIKRVILARATGPND